MKTGQVDMPPKVGDLRTKKQNITVSHQIEKKKRSKGKSGFPSVRNEYRNRALGWNPQWADCRPPLHPSIRYSCAVFSCSVVSNSLWPHAQSSSVHGDSPGKNTGAGGHFLLQGIFLTQGSNPGLLHCRQILYCLSHQESPVLWYNYHFNSTLQFWFTLSLSSLM